MNNKFVLVCDDDKGLNADIKQAIEKRHSDCKVISVYDKNGALDALKLYYFTVAIIDLNLEGPPPLDWSHTGGVEVIEKIRETGFSTNIIVVSANPETELSFSLSQKYHINDYVQKGSSINSFSNLILLIDDAIANSNIEIPNPIIQTFLGVGGVDKEILESGIISFLNIKGGSKLLESIAKRILARIYPWKILGGSKFILDKEKKCAYSKFWSYKNAKKMGVIIHNDSNNIRPSSIFKDILEIDDTFIVRNIRVVILTIK